MFRHADWIGDRDVRSNHEIEAMRPLADDDRAGTVGGRELNGLSGLSADGNGKNETERQRDPPKDTHGGDLFDCSLLDGVGPLEEGQNTTDRPTSDLLPQSVVNAW